MSKKRDIVNEIKELKGRNEFNTDSNRVIAFLSLRNAIEAIPNGNNFATELYRYVPVRIAATMESFLKSLVKKMIDSNENYFNNAKELFDTNNVKIDFEILKNIHKREFTIGELVSQHLSFSRYEQIDGVFSKLLGTNFTVQIKDYVYNHGFRNLERRSTKFRQNSDLIITSIQNIYEQRHIICHESAEKIKISRDECMNYSNYAELFMDQTYYCIRDQIYPDILKSDEERLIEEKKKYVTLEQELDEITKIILKHSKTDGIEFFNKIEFQKAQNFWKKYQKSYASMLHQNFQKDNGAAANYYEDLSLLTEDRISDLKIDFEYILNLKKDTS